ncbi:MAG: S4 domain-containing protein [Candidatus Micrarchaeia archaeon]
MALKGNKRHIKRLASPAFFDIHKKEAKYITKPNPGRHNLNKSMALVSVIKTLGLANSSAEAKKIIKSGAILVNSKIIKEEKYPVGIQDIITAGTDKSKQNYKITINQKGKISFVKVGEDANSSYTYKLVKKFKTKGNKIMLQLYDGSLIEGNKDINTGDSVQIDSNKKILRVIKMAPGTSCFIIDGIHVGTEGTIKEIIPGTRQRDKSVKIATKDGVEFETLLKNVMVI